MKRLHFFLFLKNYFILFEQLNNVLKKRIHISNIFTLKLWRLLNSFPAFFLIFPTINTSQKWFFSSRDKAYLVFSFYAPRTTLKIRKLDQNWWCLRLNLFWSEHFYEYLWRFRQNYIAEHEYFFVIIISGSFLGLPKKCTCSYVR